MLDTKYQHAVNGCDRLRKQRQTYTHLFCQVKHTYSYKYNVFLLINLEAGRMLRLKN